MPSYTESYGNAKIKVNIKLNTNPIPNNKHTHIKPRSSLFEILHEYDSVPYQVNHSALSDFIKMLRNFVQKKTPKRLLFMLMLYTIMILQSY